MNKNAIIQTVPAAASLHKVPGFDPLRYLKRVDNARAEPVLRLELGYQKLWFRMACPNGRLLLNPLRITDQMALIEARVPVSTCPSRGTRPAARAFRPPGPIPAFPTPICP